MISSGNHPPGLWESVAAPACITHALANDVSADVLVIGAGYAGLSVSLHLAEAGVSVRVLEAGAIGSGAAGRSSGFVNAGLWAAPNSVVETLGLAQGELLLQLLGDAPRLVFGLVEQHTIDCDLKSSGTLHCARDAKGLREIERRANDWCSRGADLRLLDHGQTSTMVGSAAYAGALLDRRGGTLNPLSFVRGMARAAIAAGAELHTGSPALAPERIGSRWLVPTPKGSVLADWVVVASDAYSSGPWEGLRTEQVLLPYFNIATVPLAAELKAEILPAGLGLVDSSRVMNAIRLDCAGRLVLGSVGALRGPGALVHRAWAKRELKRIFPQLQDVRLSTETWGQIGLTRDRIPRFHILGPQMLGVAGYNGRGIAAGTLFGKLIAERIVAAPKQDDFPLSTSVVEAAPFRSLMSSAYEVGAAIIHAIDH